MAEKKAVRKTVGKRTKKTCEGLCIYVWKVNPRPHWHRCFQSCHSGKRCICPRPNTPGKGKNKIPPGTVAHVACVSIGTIGKSTSCSPHTCTCDSVYDDEQEIWEWEEMIDNCVETPDEECDCPLDEPDFEANSAMHLSFPCVLSKTRKKQKSRKKTS